ncbi:unnamed protein product [Prorocentrum cordatum]|uniref:DUF2470 domain-containing protein n=1 Tax=Prorocentrum cordatum TaxID=2364126 RepID=A0ABN9T5S3_9DINO|nr:unnamed protein product [Polarella glacialis]
MYAKAAVDPCLAFAEPVMRHMNDDHEESIKGYVQYIVGTGPVESAKMKRLDRLGFDVRVKDKAGGEGVLRVPFPEPVTERSKIKAELSSPTSRELRSLVIWRDSCLSLNVILASLTVMAGASDMNTWRLFRFGLLMELLWGLTGAVWARSRARVLRRPLGCTQAEQPSASRPPSRAAPRHPRRPRRAMPTRPSSRTRHADEHETARAGASAAVALLGMAGAHRAAKGTRNASATVTRAAPKGAVLDISTQLGACPPLGFWDPLGLSKYPDPAVAATQFRRRRIIEIQHGRVAMFACIGYIVPEYFRWPGFISPSEKLAFADIPNGFGAIYAIPLVGWTQIIALAGILEVNFLSSEPKEYPGDYDGFGALGLPGGASIADKETKKKKLLAEINNGRLAMMAIIGMFFQNGLTGQAWGDWSLYADSPLRAAKGPVIDISTQLGACPPLGFWDPLGLSKSTLATTTASVPWASRAAPALRTRTTGRESCWPRSTTAGSQ